MAEANGVVTVTDRRRRLIVALAGTAALTAIELVAQFKVAANMSAAGLSTQGQLAFSALWLAYFVPDAWAKRAYAALGSNGGSK